MSTTPSAHIGRHLQHFQGVGNLSQAEAGGHGGQQPIFNKFEVAGLNGSKQHEGHQGVAHGAGWGHLIPGDIPALAHCQKKALAVVHFIQAQDV